MKMLKKYKLFFSRRAFIALFCLMLLTGCSLIHAGDEESEIYESSSALEAETSASFVNDDPEAEEENNSFEGEAELSEDGALEYKETHTETNESVFNREEQLGLDKTGKSTEAESGLFPYVYVEQESEYADVGKLLALSRYELLWLRSEGADYSELKNALALYDRSRKERAVSEYEEILALAREDSGDSEEFLGYQSVSTMDILRADESVLSFTEETYTYTGGAHGNSAVTGRSFDVNTGKSLELGDIVADTNALSDYIVGYLEDNYGSQGLLFEGWEEIVRGESQPCFAMGPEGLKIYYAPYFIGPYALGTVTVDVPYGEAAVDFKEEYLPTEEQSVWKLDPYEELFLDIDGDGTDESIAYELSESGDNMEYRLSISDGVKSVSKGGDCGYGITDAYIMKTPKDRYVFYGEISRENDWRSLSIVDVTGLWSEENLSHENEPYGYYEAFYGNVPVNSEKFYLATRGDLLSTVSLMRKYTVGDDGMPVALEDEYSYENLELRAKENVPGYVLGRSGDETFKEDAIRSGSRLEAVSTDEESYVILRNMDSGELIKVEINGEGWPRTIEGRAIEDYFDGLIFAG